MEVLRYVRLALLGLTITVVNSTSSLATEISLRWQTYPTLRSVTQGTQSVSFAVADQVLEVIVSVKDEAAGSLRTVRRVPDDFLENDTQLLIYIDGSGAGKFAKVFGVNPAGGILDGTFQEGGGLDTGADFRWTAEVTSYTTGWTAHIRIPLDQLGLSSQGTPRAYVEYIRIGDKKEIFASGNPNDKGGCTLCVAIAIPELSRMNVSGSALHLQPSIYAVSGQIGTGDTTTRYQEEKASLYAELRANESLELRATVNPNFAEREPDIPVLRYGTQFSPELAERRQFFARGSDLLQTPGFALVNTRRIAAPRWAAASEYKDENVRVLGVVANDQGGGELFNPGPYGNGISLAPASRNAIVRGVRSWDGRDVGVTATNRDFFGVGSSRMFAADGTVRFPGGYTATGVLASSNADICARADSTLTSCPAKAGTATYFNLKAQEPLSGFRVAYSDVSPQFRADMGSLGQAGTRKIDARSWKDMENPVSGISRLEIMPRVRLSQDSTGQSIERTGELYLEAVGGQFFASTTVRPFSRLRLGPSFDVVNARQVEAVISVSPGTKMSKIALDLTAGELPDYSNALGGRGASAAVEISGAFSKNFGFQTGIQAYQTHARSTVLFTGPSYREIDAIGIFNWQYATYSRVRYVLTLGRSQGVILKSSVSYTSRSVGHSLLWEHGPREGWGWTAGLTNVSVPTTTFRNGEIIVRLSYAY